ncbi:MAG: hypothetical protein WC515_07855 [Candidatus Omnitrophota bacterium]
MNDMKKTMAICVSAFLFSALIGNSMPQAVTITLLAVSGVLFIRRYVDGRMVPDMTALFLAAFFVQIVLSLAMYDKTIDTKYCGFSYMGDDYVYGDFGAIVGGLWRRGIFPDPLQLTYYNLIGENVFPQPYQIYNAVIFYLFRGNGGQVLLIINCFFHTAIILPVYFISKEFGIRRQVMLFTFLLFLFWPSTFYWSMFNFKEPLILFGMFVVFAMIFVMKRPRLLTVLILTLLLVMLYQLKNYLLALFLAVFLYLDMSWRWRWKNVAILAVLVTLTLVQMIAHPSFFDLVKFDCLPLTLYNARTAAYVSNTPYFMDMLTDTYITTLLYLPLGFCAVFFLPFLARPMELSHIVANVESIVWWSLLPFMVHGIWIAFSEKAKKSFVLLFIFFYWILILILTQGNMGTLLRQKSIIYYIGFIFTAISIERALELMRDRGKDICKAGS